MMTTPLPTATEASSAAALAKLAQTRDAEAWALLVERHGGEMLRVALRISGDTALAEDVCQETLLQLRDYAGKFQPRQNDPEGSARAWILQLTCNTALKLRRTRARANKRHREAAIMQTHASEPTLSSAERERLAQAVRTELAHLGDSFQQPLALRYYSGLDVKQVAEQLRLSEDAARKRITRGLDQLRHRLARAGIVVAAAELGTLFTLPHVAEPLSLSSHHLGQWKGLLTSPQQAALPALATTGGISLMAKCAIGFFALALVTAAGVQARKSWTSEAKPHAEAPAPQVTVIADNPGPLVTTTERVHGDSKTYPYELPFELGDQDFKPGDSITIQELRGTKNEIAGGECQVCGVYTLASAETANLVVQTGGSRSLMTVSKGSGHFILVLNPNEQDFPCVQFTTGKLRTPLGHLYFGQGASVFKSERLKNKIAFKLADGDPSQKLQAGDAIKIETVESDRTDFEIGGLYKVSGTYTLASRDNCVIAVFGTTVANEGTAGLDYIRSIVRGTGKFALTFRLIGQCWPHVSYYPADGGNTLGGVYFGNDEFLKGVVPQAGPAQTPSKPKSDEF